MSVPETPGRRILVLQLETDPVDAELATQLLRESGIPCDGVRVDSRADFVKALESRADLDLIIADDRVPGFDAAAALEVAQRRRPDLPFIVLSGVASEEEAVALLHAGATDYVHKDRRARLAPAVNRALLEKQRERERKRAEDQLEELAKTVAHRALLESVLAQMPAGVLVAAAGTGEILVANAKAEEILGASVRDARSIEDLAPIEAYRRDGSQLPPDQLPLLRAVRAGTAVSDVSLEVFGAGGLHYHVVASAAPIRDQGGRPVAVVATFADVSPLRAVENALRRSETRFRRLSESNVVGVAFWDLSGRITAANDAVLDALGATREDLQAGRLDWREMTPPEHADATARALRDLEETSVFQPFEKEFNRLDGGRVAVIMAGALLETDRTRGVAFVLDITERKRLEEELRRQVQLREQLVGIVSHDLRSPLTAVMAQAQALFRSERSNDRVVRSARAIFQSAERMSRLIHDLLDFTGIRLGGPLPIRRARVDLGVVVARIVGEAREAYPDSVVEVQGSGDLMAEVDAERLGQVISNLVENAIEHGMPAEPVRVTLAREAGNIALRVSNRGVPIPPDLLPLIFEPFRRGSTAGRRRRGIGLGLYIAQQIVLAHGGAIDVHSAADEGTTFTVRLPASAGEDHAPIAP